MKSRAENLPRAELNSRGKKSIEYCHPWIYQRSIVNAEKIKDGELIGVYYENKIQGIGFYSADSLFAVKLLDSGLNFNDYNLEGRLRFKIQKALEYRKTLGFGNNYRIFHAEADGIPGLFIDRYDRLIVIQYSFNGIYKLKESIAQIISGLLPEKSLFEISPDNQKKWIKNEIDIPLQIEIDGIKFIINPFGQKTGFYLDQRENRINLAKFVKPKMRVLDVFSYTGSFALYSIKSGAAAEAVDISAPALDILKQNCEINNYTEIQTYCCEADIALKKLKGPYDIIFLDPPALTAKKNHKENALKYICRLFELSLNLLADNGIVSVSVCSRELTDSALNQTLLNACAGKNIRLRQIYEHGPSADHPVLLNFPEGGYLRCLAYSRI